MENKDSLRVFKNATAIITGGASGIGLAFAEELARLGCDVVLADRQIGPAGEAAARINKSGGRVTAVEADVTGRGDMERVVRDTVARTGRLDYMFNNAGIVLSGEFCRYCIEDWDEIIDVNLRGVLRGTEAAYRVMSVQGFGHIVNTSSLAGLMPGPGNISYTTTKHAVFGFSTSLRGEAALAGVRVSVLCPGFIRTPILDGGKYGRSLVPETQEQMDRLREMIDKLRPMDPNLFARKALKLIAKNRAVIILPSWWRIIWLLHRLFPYKSINASVKSYRKMLKKLGYAPEDTGNV